MDANKERKPPKLVQQPKMEVKEKLHSSHSSVVQRGSIMSGTPIRRMSSPLHRNQPAASLYPPGLDRALKEGLVFDNVGKDFYSIYLIFF